MGGGLSMAIRRPYQQGDLSAGRRLPNRPGKFLEMPAQKFLVEFRDLARDHRGTVSQNFKRILDRICYPMRSFIENQRAALGKPLTGDRNAGTRESGLVFQQFQGGVITVKNAEASTPAYITLGKIREAWNIPRDPSGAPAVTGSNGSAGPLGFPTSDQNAVGDLLVSDFEHGKIECNPKTGQVQVTVNGKVVPAGL